MNRTQQPEASSPIPGKGRRRLLWQFIYIFGTLLLILLLGGNDRQWMTITMFMYEVGWGNQRNFGRAAAVAWILFVVIVVIALLNYWLTSRIAHSGSSAAGASKLLRTTKGGRR